LGILLKKSNKEILNTLSSYLPLFCESSLKSYYIKLFHCLHDELLIKDFVKTLSTETKQEYYFLFKSASIHPVFKQEQNQLSLWSDNFFGDIKIFNPTSSNNSQYSSRSSSLSSSSSAWPIKSPTRNMNLITKKYSDVTNVAEKQACRPFLSGENKNHVQSMINIRPLSSFYFLYSRINFIFFQILQVFF
jgi:hypothetical protein